MTKFEYDFAMPAVTADVLALAYRPVEGSERPVPHILLITRSQEPYKGLWALPGGFTDSSENVETSALRELQEETGLVLPMTREAIVNVYSGPDRDPRGWVISVLYAVYVADDNAEVAAGDDAADAQWVAVRDLADAQFAFDHAQMIEDGLRRFGLAIPG